ncbi:MAG: 6-phosphogluconolactonase [Planctomycetaceae bacterium]|nr:6-phosphogluconolactonase [Planctomycetaceae bacterium]
MSPHRTRIIQLVDPAALAARACEEVQRAAHEALEQRGVFHLALSGGSTPKLLYRALAESGADFSRWHVHFGDERCVPPGHADSNFRMASEAWLGRGQVPAAQVHRIQGELEPAQAAREYERELVASLGATGEVRLDLALLGLGTDGHTASLFPGSSALAETSARVAATFVEKLAAQRITLTLPMLNESRAVLFLVAGSDKVDALRELFHGDPEARPLPAALVRPREGNVTWMVDGAAAAGLQDE